MKFEIDLNDILGDEYGSETIQESIKRQVVDTLVNFSRETLKEKIDSEVTKVVDEEIKEAVNKQMPGIINDLINQEYQITGRFGEKGEITTFRNQLLRRLQEEMKYNPQRYDSDNNVFTRTVIDVVKESMTEFKELFKKNVDDIFFKEAVDFAIHKIKTSLGMCK